MEKKILPSVKAISVQKYFTNSLNITNNYKQISTMNNEE